MRRAWPESARLGELPQAQVGLAAPGGGFAPAPTHALQVVAQVLVDVGTAAHQTAAIESITVGTGCAHQF
jgi:hypothetical protein